MNLFAGIDPIAVIDIQNIISDLKSRGISILISDHNVRETLGVCDRGYILNQGQVLEYGTPEQITASPVAREIYLGDGIQTLICFGVSRADCKTIMFELQRNYGTRPSSSGKKLSQQLVMTPNCSRLSSCSSYAIGAG